MRLAALLALLPVVLLTGQAQAACACLCVDGALQTVCTDADAARGHPALCLAQAGQACPAPPQTTAPPKRYAAPVDGVADCRDALVYDVSSGGYVTQKVCDAVPDQTQEAGPG